MSSDFYDELIQRNDVLAVARELGLAVRGTRCRCLHPDAHANGDRTPSVSLNRRRNTFHCWVCPNVGGSVIDLVMLARGVSLDEAVAYLAARVGMERPGRGTGGGGRGTSPASPWHRGDGETGRRGEGETGRRGGPDAGTAAGMPVVREEPVPYALVPPPAPSRPEPEAEPQIDEELVCRIYARFLFWCDRVGPSNYLIRLRGITEGTAGRMGIVWVHSPKEVEGKMRRDFQEEELVASGIFNEWGLVFRHHRIVFPFTRRGQVRFLQGRCVDGREPKYLSVRRPICCLYNHDLLEKLSSGDAVVLSEGVVDTLTWLDHGVPAVGVLGVGTFKAEWLDDFRGRRVLICFDNDEPGVRAGRALRERFLAAGQHAHLVALPEGAKDVNQLFLDHPDLDGRSVIP